MVQKYIHRISPFIAAMIDHSLQDIPLDEDEDETPQDTPSLPAAAPLFLWLTCNRLTYGGNPVQVRIRPS